MVTPLSGSDKPRDFPPKFNALLDDVDTKATQEALDNATSGLASETYVDSVALDTLDEAGANAEDVASRRVALRFDGTADNYVQTPNQEAFDSITDEIDLRVHVALAGWRSGAHDVLITKFLGSDKSWLFWQNANDNLSFFWTENGTTNQSHNLSPSLVPDPGPGGAVWLRVTFLGDNSDGGHEVRFYSSDDGEDWTQLGDAFTGPVSSLYVGDSPVRIGGYDHATRWLDGDVFYAEVRDGIDGAVVASFDSSAAVEDGRRHTDPQGRHWGMFGDEVEYVGMTGVGRETVGWAGSANRRLDMDEFMVVLIPDTQYLSDDPDWLPHFGALADWIVDNKEHRNIQLVLHLGDVVQQGTTTQYDRADGPMTKLFDAGIPFAACIGNHDYDGATGGSVADHDDTTQWNAYFGPGRYTDRPWWDGGFKDAGKSENMYLRCTLGGRPTLVLVLEFFPRAATMAWAEEVIEAHPQRDVIVLTHAFMFHDGTRTEDGNQHGPQHYSITDTTSGEQMWQNHLRKYHNVVGVYSGHHINGPNTAHRADYSDAGTLVAQEFQNWQNEDQGGDGRIVPLTINPVTQIVDREVYNPRLDAFEDEFERAWPYVAYAGLESLEDRSVTDPVYVPASDLRAISGTATDGDVRHRPGLLLRDGRLAATVPLSLLRPSWIGRTLAVDVHWMTPEGSPTSGGVRFEGYIREDDDGEPVGFMTAPLYTNLHTVSAVPAERVPTSTTVHPGRLIPGTAGNVGIGMRRQDGHVDDTFDGDILVTGLSLRLAS